MVLFDDVFTTFLSQGGLERQSKSVFLIKKTNKLVTEKNKSNLSNPINIMNKQNKYKDKAQHTLKTLPNADF